MNIKIIFLLFIICIYFLKNVNTEKKSLQDETKVIKLDNDFTINEKQYYLFNDTANNNMICLKYTQLMAYIFISIFGVYVMYMIQNQ
jgi:hypothetical protein